MQRKTKKGSKSHKKINFIQIERNFFCFCLEVIKKVKMFEIMRETCIERKESFYSRERKKH